MHIYWKIGLFNTFLIRRKSLIMLMPLCCLLLRTIKLSLVPYLQRNFLKLFIQHRSKSHAINNIINCIACLWYFIYFSKNMIYLCPRNSIIRSFVFLWTSIKHGFRKIYEISQTCTAIYNVINGMRLATMFNE